jgi:hypothetical protein
MAVHKAIRSNPSVQPTRRRPNLQSKDSQPEAAQLKDPSLNGPQLKSQLFETLRHLNRGFGVALAAFDRLQRQDRLQKPGIFPWECLRDYRNRTEELRALANRDLLRLFAGREDQDVERFGRLVRQPVKIDC